MKLSFSENVPADWEVNNERFGANFFHSVNWADARRAAGSKPLYGGFVDDNGELLGMVLAFEDSSRFPVLKGLTREWTADAMPVFADNRPELLQEGLGLLRSLAEESGCVGLTVNSYCNDISVQDPGNEKLTARKRLEFVLDCTPELEEIFSGFNSNSRRNVRKGMKSGLGLRVSTDIKDLDVLSELMGSTEERRTARGEDYSTSRLPKRDRALLVSGCARLFFAELEGKPVSAAFIITYLDTAIYYKGGNAQEGLKHGAAAWMFYNIIERLRVEEIKRLNMGGVAEGADDPEAVEHGLYRFKAGLGAIPLERCNVEAVGMNEGRRKLGNFIKKILGR